MTPIESQLLALQQINAGAKIELLRNGSYLVTVPDVALPAGWNRDIASVLFVAPPGYPAARPDCFWVGPPGMRLANESTPQGTSDGNPIPDVGQLGTWFSWHLQRWDPNYDSLTSYFRVIMQRLHSVQ